MTVRSAILSAGIVSTTGYSELIRGPANETLLIKGLYATSQYNGTNGVTFYLWGPAGGQGLNIFLGSPQLTYLQPYSLALWIPLNPDYRIGVALGQQPLHFVLTGSVLYGVATIPPGAFPVFLGNDAADIFTIP